MTRLLKIAYWIGGIFLYGFLSRAFGGGDEYLAETNFIYWLGETALFLGWIVGMVYLSTLIWKD